MKRLLRWLLRADLAAAYEMGYEDCRAASFSEYVPLLHNEGRWPHSGEVIGYVKRGWEWIADKASRQNVADYAAAQHADNREER